MVRKALGAAVPAWAGLAAMHWEGLRSETTEGIDAFKESVWAVLVWMLKNI